jgi:hypothetical protein
LEIEEKQADAARSEDTTQAANFANDRDQVAKRLRLRSTISGDFSPSVAKNAFRP